MLTALWIFVGSIIYLIVSSWILDKSTGPTNGTSGALGAWILLCALPTAGGFLVAAVWFIVRFLEFITT